MSDRKTRSGELHGIFEYTIRPEFSCWTALAEQIDIALMHDGERMEYFPEAQVYRVGQCRPE